MNTRKLTISSLIVAIGVLSSNIIYIPLGVSKIFPVQHAINLLMSVLFGPLYSVVVAFVISLLRNLLGTGSLLAFPGSMIGAFLAGIIFMKTRNMLFSAIGEVIGTGILGALIAYPVAEYFLGKDATLFFFVTPFILSALAGAIIGYVLLKTILKTKSLNNYIDTK